MLSGKILTVLFMMAGFHPIHISVTNMEYVQDKKAFDVYFKIFWDDFETIIQKNYGVYLKLTQPDERKDKEMYFSKYISDHFKIIADGKLLAGNLKNAEIRDKSIWIFYSYPCPPDTKRVEVEDKLMMDMFDDQKNLFMFKFGKIEKAYSLKQGKEKIVFDLSND